MTFANAPAILSPMAPVAFANDTLTETFADNLRVALARKRMSARELGRRLDVSHTWVSLRATGAQSPTLRDVHLIADELGVSPGELLGLDKTDLRSEAQDVNDILTDQRIPRTVREYFLGLIGQAVALAYAQVPKRRALPGKATGRVRRS